jgi:hypothetical protein
MFVIIALPNTVNILCCPGKILLHQFYIPEQSTRLNGVLYVEIDFVVAAAVVAVVGVQNFEPLRYFEPPPPTQTVNLQFKLIGK